MRSQDTKKLWGQSGNICSFPDCGVELTSSKKVNRVLGEEAHIKGEKLGAARYDQNQSLEERESYENKILLCPNHHTEIDADEATWTVVKLLRIKQEHEKRIVKNRQMPFLVDAIKKALREYDEQAEGESLPVYDILDSTDQTKIIRVDASNEEGTNTGIQIKRGQKLLFFASGLITYDGGIHFANPEGFICNEYGLSLAIQDGDELKGPVVWAHEQAYRTNGQELGRIGSLIGWIDTYSPERAFLIGVKREVVFDREGQLFLMINDAQGTYTDNDGEYRVTIRVVSEQP